MPTATPTTSPSIVLVTGDTGTNGRRVAVVHGAARLVLASGRGEADAVERALGRPACDVAGSVARAAAAGAWCRPAAA